MFLLWNWDASKINVLYLLVSFKSTKKQNILIKINITVRGYLIIIKILVYNIYILYSLIHTFCGTHFPRHKIQYASMKCDNYFKIYINYDSNFSAFTCFFKILDTVLFKVWMCFKYIDVLKRIIVIEYLFEFTMVFDFKWHF